MCQAKPGFKTECVTLEKKNDINLNFLVFPRLFAIGSGQEQLKFCDTIFPMSTLFADSFLVIHCDPSIPIRCNLIILSLNVVYDRLLGYKYFLYRILLLGGSMERINWIASCMKIHYATGIKSVAYL